VAPTRDSADIGRTDHLIQADLAPIFWTWADIIDAMSSHDHTSSVDEKPLEMIH
jgi:hypothetical protein